MNPFTEEPLRLRFTFLNRQACKFQLSKLKSVAFLKRCKISGTIPVFALINHRLQAPQNRQVFLKASLALLRSQTNRVRRTLDLLSRNLLALHLELSGLISASLWARIDACSALKSLRMEDPWKQKQASKFQKLAQRSSVINSPLAPLASMDRKSQSRLSTSQRTALQSWVCNFSDANCPPSNRAQSSVSYEETDSQDVSHPVPIDFEFNRPSCVPMFPHADGSIPQLMSSS